MNKNNPIIFSALLTLGLAFTSCSERNQGKAPIDNTKVDDNRPPSASDPAKGRQKPTEGVFSQDVSSKDMIGEIEPTSTLLEVFEALKESYWSFADNPQIQESCLVETYFDFASWKEVSANSKAGLPVKFNPATRLASYFQIRGGFEPNLCLEVFVEEQRLCRILWIRFGEEPCSSHPEESREKRVGFATRIEPVAFLSFKSSQRLLFLPGVGFESRPTDNPFESFSKVNRLLECNGRIRPIRHLEFKEDKLSYIGRYRYQPGKPVSECYAFIHDETSRSSFEVTMNEILDLFERPIAKCATVEVELPADDTPIWIKDYGFYLPHPIY